MVFSLFFLFLFHIVLYLSVLTSSQLGELREISSMFTLKTQHGFIEAQAPMVIEHKKTTDLEAINAQLEALKGNKIIEAEYEEIN